MDLEDRIRALGGAARAQEFATTGAHRRILGNLVRSGRVVDHGGGCYALPEADPALTGAIRLRGHLTCLSAARVHGFAVLDSSRRPHIAIPAHRNPRRLGRAAIAGATIHREPPAMLTCVPHPMAPQASGRLVAAPAEMLARVLRCQDAMAAVVTIDSALNRRACTPRDIGALLVGPGARAARAVLDECDGRSQSPPESIARVVLRRAGLHVEANVPIPGVGFVDLLVEGRVVVELDGFAYHSGRREYREDRRRDRELVAQGFLVLRFTWEDVIRSPDEVVRGVRAALARA